MKIRIPDLQNKSTGLEDSNYLAVDDGIQSYRLSGQQLFDYVDAKSQRLLKDGSNSTEETINNICGLPCKTPAQNTNLNDITKKGLYLIPIKINININQPFVSETTSQMISLYVFGNPESIVQTAVVNIENNDFPSTFQRKLSKNTWSAWMKLSGKATNPGYPDWGTKISISSGYIAEYDGFIWGIYDTWGQDQSIRSANIFINGVKVFENGSAARDGRDGGGRGCCMVPVLKGETITISGTFSGTTYMIRKK
ncbi:hypothetical protein Dip510_000070 [Elusimicrobium posterum]|uniref:hypothetical protein n=1 Tax=Elusimicrobium posterum TaxID=3116653 RepID=UPI003C72E645